MKLGITGGIASGKSAVAKIFGDLGAATISADEISRRLTGPNMPVTKDIIDTFGTSIVVPGSAGEIDRKKLGEIVFNDPDARAKLESITHPAILKELSRAMDEISSANPDHLIAVEVPLLFEVGLETMFDHVAVVRCGYAAQVARLRKRLPEMSEKAANQRVCSQMPLDEKCRRADIVIDSEQAMVDMASDVRSIYERLLLKQPNSI